MTAPQYPRDHTAPLPPAVVGRGTDEITDDDVAAMYEQAEQTGGRL
jgi:hypothetical protein